MAIAASHHPAGSASPYLRRGVSSPGLGLAVIAGMLAIGGGCAVALAFGELEAFYVALSAIAGIAVLFDFRIGAALLIVILPLETSSVAPHTLFDVPGLNPLSMLGLATLVSYAFRGNLVKLAPKPLVWLYIVPILVAGALGMPHISEIPWSYFDADPTSFTDATGYFRDEAIRPMVYVVIALLVGKAVARSKKPESFIYAMIAAVWAIAIVEFAFIAMSGMHLSQLASPSQRQFFNQIGLHANSLGRIFAVAYALLVFVWWETKRPGMKSLLFLTLCTCVIAMMLTFSRGAIFGFFVVNAVFLLWKFNSKSLALALAAVAVAAMISPEYVWNRITFGFDADANTVSADRLNGIWLPLLPELLKSPIWGNGLGSTLWSAPFRTGQMLLVNHPHNAYLEVLLDMGIAGAALLGAYYLHVWRGFRALGSNANLSAELRALFQGATAALVCFFVTGMSGGSLRPDPEFAFLWIAIGMMYGMRERRAAG